MLTNPQKALLKRAQRQAGIPDAEYREHLHLLAGVRSSTDPKMSNEHFDLLMPLFEAFYWCAVDSGTRPAPENFRDPVFAVRGFWAARNTKGNTTRDRFNGEDLRGRIAALENDLAALGRDEFYCGAIRRKVTRGRDDARALQAYCAALARTLKTKTRRETQHPF